MATTEAITSDPLLSLRRAIAAQALPSPTTSPDVSTAKEGVTDDLAKATHLFFTHPTPHTIPLNTATRFVSAASNDTPVDLRSIFFAWQKKDVAIPEYIASAQEVNEALKQQNQGGGKPEQILNLVFVERLDLITWLEGASDDSEYIKPLEGDAAAAAAAAAVAAPSAAATQETAVPAPTAAAAVSGARPAKVIDPRLQEIYNGERKLGDRNTVLYGIKPTDFSHVRKKASVFLDRNRNARPGTTAPASGKGGIIAAPSAGLPLPKKPGMPSSSSSSRRVDPIILLSPSASSPIRLSNIVRFLQDGEFVPPDHPTLASQTTSNIKYITRHLRLNNDPATGGGPGKPSGGAIGSSSGGNPSSRRPTRFILADSTANFKPDYWQRLVAVFTTGQAWQFKSYKWSNPPELFRHAAGIHVNMTGDPVPTQIKDWGRGVSTFSLARWDERKGSEGAGRWLDREIVERIWGIIEQNMKAKGMVNR